MISRSATRQKSSSARPGRAKVPGRKAPAIDHAVRLIHRVCCLAGSADVIDEVRSENGGSSITASIRNGDTPALFDHLVSALSYQGISDQVAEAYMERYGSATWASIAQKLGQGATCPKLKSYWHFHGCRYDKVSGTCAEPDHIQGMPAAHPLFAERSAQPDGLFAVPVHPGYCRWRPGGLDRPAPPSGR
jgi:hypothetical protein